MRPPSCHLCNVPRARLEGMVGRNHRPLPARPVSGEDVLMSKPQSSGSRGPSAAATPRLLSGGNPKIAKSDGDAPVQAYIAAMPGWKSEVGRRLDALVARTVPGVRKAVKWNSPFYGIEGQGWFLSFHCFTRYIKLAFFRGAALSPPPPVMSRDENTRYFHIHEDEPLDEKRLERWIRQASELPGWIP
jgi:hypothetical protein